MLYFIIVYYSIYVIYIYIYGVLYIYIYMFIYIILYNNVSICSCTPIHACWYVYTWTFAYLIVQVHEGENEITEWKTRYGPRAFCIILKRHPSLYVLKKSKYDYVWWHSYTTMQGNLCYMIIEFFLVLPSGKHTKSYWKWPFIVSFPIKMVIFHSFLYVYQRV